MDKVFEKLSYIKEHSGQALTTGLSQGALMPFLNDKGDLTQAVDKAYQYFLELMNDTTHQALLALDESELLTTLQSKLVQFYDAQTVQPYVPLAAAGPWIVTSHGAVVYDCGGYGMLSFGHDPDTMLAALAKPQMMANVMTANFSQRLMSQALDNEITHNHSLTQSPYRYMFLNSGSEGVSLAARLSDLNAAAQLDDMQKPIRFVSLEGSFHGRTDRPAQASDSCRLAYKKHLASFQKRDKLLTVPPNDLTALRAVFEHAKNEGIFIEAMFIEPVMGEGDPGKAVTLEFYQLARELTQQHGSLLVIDSVQAGLRCQGVLSILDYPGFEHIIPPDIEVFSKAINGGQYPLSVIAANQRVQDLFTTGLYGNTMTANPRALDVSVAVLAQMNNETRRAVVLRGEYFKQALLKLKQRFPKLIKKVQGTGLLLSASIDKHQAKVMGEGGLEIRMRKSGVNVIHGGENALRFTPPFTISEQEVDLICAELTRCFIEYDKC